MKTFFPTFPGSWIFQWSKSSYLHACRDFFWKPFFFRLFVVAEFSVVKILVYLHAHGYFLKTFFSEIFVLLIFQWSKILIYVHVLGFFFENLLFFGIFVLLNFQWSKILVCTCIWGFLLKILSFFPDFSCSGIFQIENPRMDTRAGISFENLFSKFSCYWIFQWSKILVCHARWDFFWKPFFFPEFSCYWIFLMSKSSYVHACGNFFWKLFFQVFALAEFSAVKILICTRVWRFLLKTFFFLDF